MRVGGDLHGGRGGGGTRPVRQRRLGERGGQTVARLRVGRDADQGHAPGGAQDFKRDGGGGGAFSRLRVRLRLRLGKRLRRRRRSHRDRVAQRRQRRGGARGRQRRRRRRRVGRVAAKRGAEAVNLDAQPVVPPGLRRARQPRHGAGLDGARRRPAEAHGAKQRERERRQKQGAVAHRAVSGALDAARRRCDAAVSPHAAALSIIGRPAQVARRGASAVALSGPVRPPGPAGA